MRFGPPVRNPQGAKGRFDRKQVRISMLRFPTIALLCALPNIAANAQEPSPALRWPIPSVADVVVEFRSPSMEEALALPDVFALGPLPSDESRLELVWGEPEDRRQSSRHAELVLSRDGRFIELRDPSYEIEVARNTAKAIIRLGEGEPRFEEAARALQGDEAEARIRERVPLYWRRWHEVWRGRDLALASEFDLEGGIPAFPAAAEHGRIIPSPANSGTVTLELTTRIPRDSCLWLAGSALRRDLALTPSEVASLPEGQWEIRTSIEAEAKSGRPRSIREEERFIPREPGDPSHVHELAVQFSWLDDVAASAFIADRELAAAFAALVERARTEPAGVIAPLQEIVAARPEPEHRIALARAALAAERPEAAFGTFDSLPPTSPQEVAWFARLEIARGRLTEAAELIDHTLAVEKSYELEKLRTHIAWSLGDAAGAWAAFEKRRDHLALARCLIAVGRFDGATRECFEEWDGQPEPFEERRRRRPVSPWPRLLIVALTGRTAPLSTIPPGSAVESVIRHFRGEMPLAEVLANMPGAELPQALVLAATLALVGGDREGAREHLETLSRSCADTELQCFAIGALREWDRPSGFRAPERPPTGEAPWDRLEVRFEELCRELSLEVPFGQTPAADEVPPAAELAAGLREVSASLSKATIEAIAEVSTPRFRADFLYELWEEHVEDGESILRSDAVLDHSDAFLDRCRRELAVRVMEGSRRFEFRAELVDYLYGEGYAPVRDALARALGPLAGKLTAAGASGAQWAIALEQNPAILTVEHDDREPGGGVTIRPAKKPLIPMLNFITLRKLDGRWRIASID